MKIMKNKRSHCSTTIMFVIVVVICMIIGLSVKGQEAYDNDDTIVFSQSTTEDISVSDSDEDLSKSEITVVETDEPTTTSAIEATEEKVTETIEESVETEIITPEETQSPTEKSETSEALYSAAEFMYLGVIEWNGWKWTWYSEKVLAGGGLDIPDRHVDSNGYVCDGDDYICLASSVLSKGTVISTPFGKEGKVYDCGCANDVVDVYVSW